MIFTFGLQMFLSNICPLHSVGILSLYTVMRRFVVHMHTAGGSLEAEEWQRKCASLLSDPHVAERMSRIWGVKFESQINNLKSSFDLALKEYVDSRDISEVRKILHDLSCPQFHHEFVKQLLLFKIDFSSDELDDGDCLLELLGALVQSRHVSATHLTVALEKIVSTWEQIEIDCPNAKKRISSIIKYIMSNNLIEANVIETIERSIESDDAGTSILTALANFKSKCTTMIQEYFDSGSTSEVERELVQIMDPGFHSVFVKMVRSFSNRYQ